MARERLEDNGGRLTPATNFFAQRSEDLDFFSTGCTLLDCTIGGGWVLGRIGNVVGDRSTGKTLLMIEACANFIRTFPKGRMRYREAEAAFDRSYADALGMPIDRVEFGDEDQFRTVSDFFNDLGKFLDECTKSKKPGLYIVDSLDALSDTAELERDFDKSSYGANKPKQMGELFRRLVQRIEASQVCVLIVSQVRDKIGITFGQQHTRSGGRALDFYASQIVWLHHIKTLSRQYQKIERAVGVRIKAKCTKCKVGLPFRDCTFEISFGFGIDDVGASMSWLADVAKDGRVLDGRTTSQYFKWIDSLDREEYNDATHQLDQLVQEAWAEIETSFLPTRRKYED